MDSRKKKPRIIFLGPLPPPAMGPTLATEVILNSDLKEQFELIHLDTSDHRPLTTLGALDFTNIYLAIKSYFDLVWLIVTRRPAAVYIPVSQTTVGYLRDSGHILISRCLFTKVICHLRGGNFQRWLAASSGLTRIYVRAIHSLVNGQIVLGECLRPLFKGYVRDSRIFTVPNGKDVEFPSDISRNRSGRLRILYLANMRRTKGVLDALHAVPIICKTHSNVEFLFAGAWNEPDLKCEIEAFLQDNPELPITWIGKITGEEKYRLIASCDMLVFPSYYPPEGHPWVIVECLAAGLPIISTDQGAIKESVLDGENGFIVNKRNPSDVAKHVDILLCDGELRCRMGNRSKQLYEQSFTEQAMVNAMAAAFRSVIA
jgi:glycosyltransferase involved in cell wall biosynthesis